MGEKRKSEQVRIPDDVAEAGRMVASALGLSWPKYVEQEIRKALARDLPRAAKIVAERAAAEQGRKDKHRDNA